MTFPDRGADLDVDVSSRYYNNPRRHGVRHIVYKSVHKLLGFLQPSFMKK